MFSLAIQKVEVTGQILPKLNTFKVVVVLLLLQKIERKGSSQDRLTFLPSCLLHPLVGHPPLPFLPRSPQPSVHLDLG